MGKNVLHSLLAVEGDLKNISSKVLREAVTTFNKKDDHFDGLVKEYTAFDEANSNTNNTESKSMVTTVLEKIVYVQDPIAKAINATVSKEETNSSQNAVASLIVGDVNFGTFSATSLLALEKELAKIRDMYARIPTLDPVKKWARDEMVSGMVYKTDPVTTFRTQKVEDFVIVVEPTEHHPAQTAKVTKDVTIGKYETTYSSGKITPLMKSKLLEKIDLLIQAAKKARSAANGAEVVSTDIGNKIFDFINAELK